MTDNMIVAIISLGGVIFSALISYLISKKNSEHQIKTLLHKYSDILFQKRLETYPKFYNIISKFSKSSKQNGLSKQLIEETLSELDKWDSQNVLLLGQKNVILLNKFIKKLRALSNNLGDNVNYEGTIKDIINNTIEIEHALKLELGVYSLTEFQNSSLTIKSK